MRKMVTSRICCCCGKSASTASKIISFVDMFIFTFFFLILGSAVALLALSPNTMEEIFPFKEDLHYFLGFKKSIRFYMLGSLMAWCLAEIGFALLLLSAARQRSYPMIRAWIFLIIVDCLFGMMVFIPLAAISSQRIIYVVLAFAYYLYRIFALWTVHSLLREVMSEIHFV